jgi:hypothetical protein
MSIKSAIEKFREFHRKEPNEKVYLGVTIPRYFCPVGFAVQISYISNKWNKESDWRPYVHWWENPTFVCVDRRRVQNVRDEFGVGFLSDQVFDIGPNRNEVTFLGHAIDFNVADEDRSYIKVKGQEMLTMRSPEELKKLRGSYTFEFDDDPETSEDYIVCSPNGRIVYAICNDTKDVFAFISPHCEVTSHGIEG